VSLVSTSVMREIAVW